MFSVSSVQFSCSYLRLLIFLLAILIPVCASSSPAFHMMYFAYKLNKQGDNIQPWCTPFPIWNRFIVPCLFLTVVCWPANRYIRRQVKYYGIPISLRIFHIFLWSTQLTYQRSSKRRTKFKLEIKWFLPAPTMAIFKMLYWFCSI